MDVILRLNIIPPWLNLNSKCCFSISKFKTQLKMTLSRYKPTENICKVSDFQKTMLRNQKIKLRNQARLD